MQALAKHDARKKGQKGRSFSDKTLITNLVNVLNSIDNLNLLNDPALTAFVADCRRQLTSVGAADLKTDDNARQNTMRAADKLLERMKGYTG